MGNNICCDEKEKIQSKHKISTINKKNSDSKRVSLFFDANSTSDDEEEVKASSVARTQVKKIEKVEFSLKAIEIQVSSIQIVSQTYQDLGEQKFFLSFLQKLQKEIKLRNLQSQSSFTNCFLTRDEKNKLNEQKFIEHSTNCPVCFQLLENIKNFQNGDPVKLEQDVQENRISLRNSLLEFEQDDKAKRSAECRCQVLNSSEQAKKALQKFSNTNKYQIKRLKFRKTSQFQPQINEERQSIQTIQSQKQKLQINKI